jgi:aminoglycoside phosphotransferase (APT) family kinase protein
MNLVHDHAPTIPVPCVLAAYQTCEKTDGSRTTYIISDWIDGCSLDNIWDGLSVHDKDDIYEQLQDIIRTLRQISPPAGQHFVGAVGYMPCTDPLIFDQGPFKDIPSFNTALTAIARPYFRWNLLSVVERSLARTDSYRIVFTHGDLNISNIMVRQSTDPSDRVTESDRWRIVALVDWEYAGWYPEHWEYVKILSSVKWRSDWAARAQNLLDRHYDEEFLLDNRLRMHLRI